MSVRKEDLEVATSSIKTIERTHELVETLLSRNGRDIAAAAKTMRPYGLAYGVLRSLTSEIKNDPVAAFEAIKLILDFVRTTHDDIMADIETAWKLEREADVMLSGAATDGGELRLMFYPDAVALVKGYLNEGKGLLAFSNSWANWGTNEADFVSSHQATSRKTRNSVQITNEALHGIARELYSAAKAEADQGAA